MNGRAGLLLILSIVLANGCNRSSTTPKPKPKPQGPRRFTGDTPPQSARIGDIWINPKDDAELVYVPEGSFVLGSSSGEKSEQPQRTIGLDAYWIYRNEVTNEQFSRFVKDTKFVTFAEAKGKGRRLTWKAESPKGSQPVVRVTRDDALAYCQWAGARLPTEAEWEKAARGTDGRLYPWGNQWNPQNCVNSVLKKLPEPHDTGTNRPSISPFGAMDMSGNVWEWVSDFFDAAYYARMPEKNPQQVTGHKMGVIRGGSYATKDPRRLTCVKRQQLVVYANMPDVGFRCARSR